MIYLVISVLIIWPIVGLAEMENGGVSSFISIPGAPNGATVAYFIHIIAFFIGFIWIGSRKKSNQTYYNKIRHSFLNQKKVNFIVAFCALLFTALAFIIIFGFGGRDVLSGKIDKASFRVNLGHFGAIIPLSTKWYIPALFALLIKLCIDYGWNIKRILYSGIAFCALAAFAMSQGFKTTLLFMLLPACIICNWKLSMRNAIVFFLFATISIICFSFLFDKNATLGVALGALWNRLTILQSDLTWFTWDVAVNNGEFPQYSKTFLPIFGNTILMLVTKLDSNTNYEEIASYYYGPAMTLFGGYPAEGLQQGVNNQATLFAECVIIGGRYFFPVVSFAFGLLIGKIVSYLRYLLLRRKYAMCVTMSTFFSFPIIMLTLGNGLASLLYIFNIFGFLSTYLIIIFLLNVRLSKSCKRNPKPLT